MTKQSLLPGATAGSGYTHLRVCISPKELQPLNKPTPEPVHPEVEDELGKWDVKCFSDACKCPFFVLVCHYPYQELSIYCNFQ